MTEPKPPADAASFFARGGATGTLLAQLDWAQSTLGPVASWPPALRSALELALLSRSSTCVWWGPRFVQLYNDAAIAMLGERHPKSLGQTGAEVWTSHWTSMGPLLEATYRGASGQSSSALELMVPRGGRVDEAHFNFSYAPIPDGSADAGIGGVLATVVEITQEVYARRQLRTLAELQKKAAEALTDESACEQAALTLSLNSADFPSAFIYLLDESGSNARLISASGIKIEELQGALPLRFPLGVAEPDDAGPGGELPVARVLRQRRSEVAPAGRAKLPTGKWQQAADRVIILPLHSPELPRPYGVLLAAISPHRELDEQYRSFFELAADQITAGIRRARARNEALVTQRAKDEFLATLNHELRTPLTAILGWATMLKRDPSNPARVGRGLEVIERNAKAEAELLNELLDASRILKGKLELELRETELADVLRAASEVVRPAAEARGIELVLALDEQLGVIVADPERLQQIAWNLLSNAVRFSAPGQRVLLSSERQAEQVVVRVQDDGAGIASEQLPHVFERFWQGDNSTTRMHGGLGLGLSNVRHLVEAQGGTVTAESQGRGRGAIFTVSLPNREAVRRAAQGGDEGEGKRVGTGMGAAPSGALRSLAGARALVVDDEEDALEILCLQLQDAGLLVTSATSGALALAAPGPFDVIVSDIGMPEMDGFVLIQRLRAQGISTPAIALTAYARKRDAERALEAGYQEHLAKPANDEELLAALRRLLSLQRL